VTDPDRFIVWYLALGFAWEERDVRLHHPMRVRPLEPLNARYSRGASSVLNSVLRQVSPFHEGLCLRISISVPLCQHICKEPIQVLHKQSNPDDDSHPPLFAADSEVPRGPDIFPLSGHFPYQRRITPCQQFASFNFQQVK
jgi:hypothetical protein